MHLHVIFAVIAFVAVVASAAGRVPLWVAVFFLALIALIEALPASWT